MLTRRIVSALMVLIIGVTVFADVASPVVYGAAGSVSGNLIDTMSRNVAENYSGTWADPQNYDISWFNLTDTTYYIGSPAQLAGLMVLSNGLSGNGKVSFSGKNIVLTQSLDMSGHYWIPIINFDGSIDGGFYDGNGKLAYCNLIYGLSSKSNVISGLYTGATGSGNNIAFLGMLSGNMKNIGFVNAYFSGVSYVSVIAGQVRTGSNIQNCYVIRSVVDSVANSGTIAGVSDGNIVECSVTDVYVLGGSANRAGSTEVLNIGGIAGRSTGTISDCFTTSSTIVGQANGGKNLGGIVGHLEGGTMTGSFSRVNVIGMSENKGFNYVGGVAGIITGKSSITDSYSISTVKGVNYVGGFIGSNGVSASSVGNSTVKNCYSLGGTNGVDIWTTGSFAGFNAPGCVIERCYAQGGASVPSSPASEFIGGNYGALRKCYTRHTGGYYAIWDKRGTENDASVLKDSLFVVGDGAKLRNEGAGLLNSGEASRAWVTAPKVSQNTNSNNNENQGYPVLTYFAYGNFDGQNIESLYRRDSDGAYLVETAYQLRMIRYFNQKDNSSAVFRLGRNISLAAEVGYDGTWLPFSMAATFDGNGYSIFNVSVLNSNSSSVGVGFFSSVSNVKNLSIPDVIVIGSAEKVGGIAGIVSGTVSCCLVGGVVSGGNYVGGIAGEALDVFACQNFASVSSSNYAGGIVGTSGSVSNSVNTGSVTANTNYAGGIVAVVPQGGTGVSRSYNLGVVFAGGSYAGGIAAESNSAVYACFNAASVSSNGESVGGIVGTSYQGSFNKNYNIGSVSGSTNVGAVLGKDATASGVGLQNSIIDCYYSSDNGILGVGNYSAEAQNSAKPFVSLGNTNLSVGESSNIVYNGNSLAPDLGQSFSIVYTLLDKSPNVNIANDTVSATAEGDAYIVHKVFIVQNAVNANGYERGSGKLYFSVNSVLTFSIGRSSIGVDPVFPTSSGNLVTGDVLKNADLVGGLGDGVFAWENPNEIVRASKSWYRVAFYPSDTQFTDWSQCPGWDPQTGSIVREVSLTVNPKMVSIVWQGTEPREYNGLTSSVSAVAEGTLPGDYLQITVSGGEEKNAGTHTATAHIIGNSDYVLPAENTTQYIINPAVVRIWWDGTDPREYDGLPSTVFAYCNTFAGEECAVTVEKGDMSDAGTYTAVAVALSNPNYTLPADNFTTYTISQKPVTISWEGVVSSIEYSGKSADVKPMILGSIEGDSCVALVDGGDKINVGNWTATVFGLSNKNYLITGDNLSFNYTINPKVIDPSTITKVYLPDQRVNSSGEKLLTKLRIDSAQIAVSDLGKTSISANVSFPSIGGPLGIYGDATVSNLVMEDPNYILSSTESISEQVYFVTQDSISGVSISSAPKMNYSYGDIFDFSDLSVNVSYSGGSTGTLTYGDFQSNSLSVQFGDGTIVDPNLKLNVSDHNGAELFVVLSDGNMSTTRLSLGFLTVTPRSVSLSWVLPENMVYDGGLKTVAAEVEGVLPGDVCYVNLSGNSASSAGNYIAVAESLSNSNYVLQGDLSYPYSIEKRTVTLTWINDNGLVYDGQSKNVGVVVGNLVGSDVCSVSVVGGNEKNAGTWVARAVDLTSLQTSVLNNYQLPEDTSHNYDIAKRSLDVVWSGTDTRQYDKYSSNVTASISGVLDGEECTVSVVGGNSVDAGIHVATAVLGGVNASNYSLGNNEFTSYIIEPRFLLNLQLAETLPIQKTLTSATKEYTLAVSASGFLPGDYSSVTVAVNFPDIATPGSYTNGVARVIGLTNQNYSCAMGYDILGVPYTVSARSITGVSVLNYPSKLSYVYGESLDLSDLRFRVQYSNGDVDDTLSIQDLSSKGMSTNIVNGTKLAVSNSGSDLLLNSGNASVPSITLGKISVAKKAITSVILPDIIVNTGSSKNFSNMQILSPDILAGDIVSISGSATYPSSGNIGTYFDAAVSVSSIHNDNYSISGMLNNQRYSVVTEITGNGFKDVLTSVSENTTISNSSSGINVGSVTEITNGTSASVKSGVVPAGTVVRLDGNKRYTLDGSTPGINSAVYSTPIVISGNMVLKVLNSNGVIEVYNYTVRKPNIKFKDNVSNIRFIDVYSDNTFRPSNPITRYEVVKSLSNLLDIEYVDGFKSFTDTSDSDVLLFANAGIIDGFPDGSFSGDQGLTRAEFVKIMSVIKGYNFIGNSQSGYPDTSGHWADAYIAFLDSFKYVKGYEDGEFRPNWVLTRAEFTVVVSRIINSALNKYAPEISDLQDMDYWAYDYIMNSFKR